MVSEQLTPSEFKQIQSFFYAASGIRLAESKKSLICGRLNARLRALNLTDYASYVRFVQQPGNEVEKQLAVDLLTTNETYFYREPKHFQLLQQMLQEWQGDRAPIIWSAACSSGEEPYTLAMLMYEAFGSRPWKILASDLSSRVLETASMGLYPLTRAKELPAELLKKYCLKGTGPYEGYLMVEEHIKQRVEFSQRNLMNLSPLNEKVDIIFLRNVLIYFDNEHKKSIVTAVSKQLRKKGWLFIGHSESLHGINEWFSPIQPAVYQFEGASV